MVMWHQLLANMVYLLHILLVSSQGEHTSFILWDPGPLSIKLLCSACEVLVVKNTKGEQ